MEFMKIVELLVVGAVGALAAILANRGIAVFNDGLRPVMPEFLDGKIGRKELAATSFALSFGLVIGFGIPVSIGASILLVHSVLLATDIIGTWSPSGKKGIIIAGAVGALYGVLLTLGLQLVIDAFALLPINFLDALAKVGSPIVVAFAVFPAIAVAYQHGFKKGAITFLATAASMFLVNWINMLQVLQINGTNIKLSVEGMSLLVGMGFLIGFAVSIKGEGNANQQLVSIFLERVKRIKANWIILAVIGGLVSAATSLALMAGDPISLNLMSQGNFTEAALAAGARGIGFIPLVFSTAIVTGVYSPAGTTFVFVAGILLQGNPIVAFIVGFIIMFVEIMLLNGVAKGLDRFPGIREMGEHIRTAMNKVLEIALLIGGALAAEAIVPGVGFFWVAGLYLLNRTMKKPVVDLAVGPIAAISLGIIINLVYLVEQGVLMIFGG